MHDNNITIGKATVVWSPDAGKWVLPGGRMVSRRFAAIEYAQIIDRLIVANTKRGGK